MSNKPNFVNFMLEEKDEIALFTSNRPEVLNALDLTSHQEIIDFAAYFESAGHLRVAIITGAGEKAFVAGADINNIKTAKGISSLKSRLRHGLSLLENSSKPVIAAINGYAFGGGLELALACDIRIVADEAVVGLPETGLGILPGAGGTQRLPRMVGMSVAKDMILAGRRLNAQEAVQYGLAYKSVPRSELLKEAEKIARRMISNGPVALQLAKKSIHAAMDSDMRTGLELEALSLAILFESEDKLEGASAFLEKRTPNYKGE